MNAHATPRRQLVIGVDGSNIRTGGGLTHLRHLLAEATPREFGIDRVVLWSSHATIARLPERPWLQAVHEPALDRSLPHRIWWQRAVLPRLAKRNCDALFAPGGNTPTLPIPVVTMSRNMLPFEMTELRRYGLSGTAARLLLLRFGQCRTFQRAAGLIFLTEYARDRVLEICPTRSTTTIIPHGVDDRFRRRPRPQRSLDECDARNPLTLLYVSILDMYKHQWHVAAAVAHLRSKGLPIAIDFVGPAYPRAKRRLTRAMRQLDPHGEFIRYRGPAAPGDLAALYASAEVFVFASSCENMPNILLEAMASGLPIASSDRGPMPEVLQEAGVYFDPEQPEAIARALERLALDENLRARSAEAAYQHASKFSWARCAEETFSFVAECARRP